MTGQSSSYGRLNSNVNSRYPRYRHCITVTIRHDGVSYVMPRCSRDMFDEFTDETVKRRGLRQDLRGLRSRTSTEGRRGPRRERTAEHIVQSGMAKTVHGNDDRTGGRETVGGSRNVSRRLAEGQPCRADRLVGYACDRRQRWDCRPACSREPHLQSRRNETDPSRNYVRRLRLRHTGDTPYRS